MKIVVLGASGGCGRQMVKQAVERGWEVTAVGRSTSSLELPDGVRIVRGELQDAGALEAAFEGADTVFSALGLNLSGLSPFSTAEVPDLLSRAAPVIIEAMKRAGVPRLVAISAGGVGDSAALMPWFYKWIVAMTSMRRLYPELEAMESVYANSDLDVCCVRPTTLTDGPHTGRVVVATRLMGQANISRADVASWMLDATEGATSSTLAPCSLNEGLGNRPGFSPNEDRVQEVSLLQGLTKCFFGLMCRMIRIASVLMASTINSSRLAASLKWQPSVADSCLSRQVA